MINAHSRENGSDTPDFILADFLANCLRMWEEAVAAREAWYGREIGTLGGRLPVDCTIKEDK